MTPDCPALFRFSYGILRDIECTTRTPVYSVVYRYGEQILRCAQDDMVGCRTIVVILSEAKDLYIR